MATLNDHRTDVHGRLEIIYRSSINGVEVVLKLVVGEMVREWVRKIHAEYPGDWTHYQVAKRLATLDPDDFQKIEWYHVTFCLATSFELQLNSVDEPTVDGLIDVHLLVLPDPTDQFHQIYDQPVDCVRVSIRGSMGALNRFGSALMLEVQEVLGIP